MRKTLMQIFPSQPDETEPATRAGFSFLNTFGDHKRGLNVKHLNYREAKISRGKKWYISFQYLSPAGWKRFKVYENVNRIKDPDEKEDYARNLAAAVDRALKEGFNPFDSEFANHEPQKTWTVSQCFNYFKQKLYDRGLRKRSIQSYESVLRMLNKNLASVLHLDVTLLRKHHIQSALSGNEWSNTTFNNNLTFVKAIFNFLIDAEIIKENPAKSIKPLPETITKHKYFDDKTWERIKKEAKPDLLEFILFLYHTGTRPNEARQIKYEHIRGDKLFIPSDISKNRKDAFVPLSKYIIEKYKGEGFIFGTSVNHFNQRFQEVKKKLKLGNDYTLYSIKHTRAIDLAKAGASPYEIMSLFRHQSLDMTMKYLRDLGMNLNHGAAEKGIRL